MGVSQLVSLQKSGLFEKLAMYVLSLLVTATNLFAFPQKTDSFSFLDVEQHEISESSECRFGPERWRAGRCGKIVHIYACIDPMRTFLELT